MTVFADAVDENVYRLSLGQSLGKPELLKKRSEAWQAIYAPLGATPVAESKGR